jgi:enoyl-CoA hydratase/carnithine racemase
LAIGRRTGYISGVPSADVSTPAPDRIERTDDGAVMTLTLVHDGKANALTESMLTSLAGHFQAEQCVGIRAAILTGSGERHFSSGAEMGSDAIPAWVERIKRIEQGIATVATAIQKASFPTIAALNGDAVGGGLELAMACDWRLAREGARLAMPPARLGLVYTAEGLRRFVREIGLARTREIFLTGRAFEASHAHQVGLVNHLTSLDELIPMANRMAAAIASNAPLAVEGMRVVVRTIQEDDQHADARAQQYRVRAFSSKDLGEGVQAARARRSPKFSGE